ncbi:hypothetical protein PCANC_24180 [Puccinia coronata f. sp. avenae]|uniref:Uncharacterized protein n=1 Tax=Puccinia coronata f. sp. avenae TaxID=200324 RepID=A0A2N5TX09_9BASI|nr:hypothetical protein PCANC_24180 [Puccinia coronata f. sp. avenae]
MSDCLLALSATLRSNTKENQATPTQGNQARNKDSPVLMDKGADPSTTRNPSKTQSNTPSDQERQANRQKEECAKIEERLGVPPKGNATKPDQRVNKEPMRQRITLEEEATSTVPKRSAKLLRGLIQKAAAAEEKGDEAAAAMFYNMYKTMRAMSQETQEGAQPPTKRLREDNSNHRQASLSLTPDDSNADSDKESEVGDLKFTSGALPKHDEMGFTPFFDKNIRELKGPIPLTIFNKTWKNAAILYNSEKRAKIKDSTSDPNRYTGLPYPSEWTQSFAEWTANHQGFHNTPVKEYNYNKFARWL